MPKVFMGCGAGTTNPQLANMVGDYSDGMFCTDMPTNLPITAYNSDPGLKATIEAFRAAFLEKHPEVGDFPTIAAEAAFTGAYTFMHNILPNAATLDADGIRAAAISTKLDITGLGFGWDIGPDGQNYAASANINQWQSGKVVTISPDKFKTGNVINVPLPVADIQ
jgi:branched-chain amino acid transport system substrate-binding protein